jgi:ketosteroid isomerase-like protein
MTTSPIGPREAVMAFYQSYATRDPERIAACLSEDAVWIAPPGNATQVALGLGDPGDAGAPDGSNNLDRDAIVDFIAHDFGRLFVSDIANDFTGLHVAGDHVVAEHRMSATLANGRSYVNDYCFVYHVVDGTIATVREYMDTRGGWVQMFGDGEPGAIVPPRPAMVSL